MCERIGEDPALGAGRPPTPDDLDELLSTVWKDPGCFLAHPRAITGKPVYSDLHNRKKSLPVVSALNSGTPAGRELDALYHGEGELSAAQLVRAAEPTTRAAAELDAVAQLAIRRDH